MDMMDITPLIAPATVFFGHYLQKGAEALAGKVTVEAATGLWNKVKSRFTTPVAQAVVAELEAKPADPVAREDFQHQLSRVLTNDPELAREIYNVLQACGEVTFMGNTQAANVTGNDNAVTQVMGNNIKIGR